jgi:hypothetical protein
MMTTYIIRHREEQLAQVFRLLLLLGHKILRTGFGQLCYAVHHSGDFLAEQLGHFLYGDIPTVLDHVVQKAGHDGGVIHAHIVEHNGDGFGVYIIRLAGFAPLLFMNFLRKIDRFLQYRKLFRRKRFAADIIKRIYMRFNLHALYRAEIDGLMFHAYTSSPLD